jgi:hypothetical protein
MIQGVSENWIDGSLPVVVPVFDSPLLNEFQRIRVTDHRIVAFTLIHR